MSDLNKVILIGRLTKDPELKQVGGSHFLTVKHGGGWQK